MMLFAETPRLRLRALEKADLPRLVELIGEWDVAKWLTLVPHPYTPADAEDWHAKNLEFYRAGNPQFFAIADKNDDALMGGVGLHPSRVPNPKPGEVEIGYWLGKSFWGQGLMSEAVREVIALGFQRPDVTLIAATTDPANQASQNILRKAGLDYLGIFPRVEAGLRGAPHITRWELTRANYQKRAEPS